MAYSYMPFPFDRLEVLPENPSETFRCDCDEDYRSAFFGWVKEGLDKPLADLKRTVGAYLTHVKETGEWSRRLSPPSQADFPPEKRTIGSIEFDTVVAPGQIFNIRAIREIQEIINEVKMEANELLQFLIETTHLLYGTENPWKGWPSLLRAAARGWAMVIIKSKLGGMNPEQGPGSSISFSMTGVVPGDSPRPCPAVITTLLKEIYIDGKVDLDENPMAFESAEELGYLPPRSDGDYMEEWEAETNSMIDQLWPMHICLKVMLRVY